MAQSQRELRLDQAFVAALLILEALFFHKYYVREVAWDVAENNDQAVFLQCSYRIQDDVRHHGPAALGRDLLDPDLRTGNGWIFPFEGAISALIFGGARLPRLAINFAAFAALQWVAFFTARRVWNRRAFGYAMLGLILSENSPWLFAGGMFDFRMDFLAYCLYGIWACAGLMSGIFLKRRWVVAAALVGGLLTLNRFICLVYMLGAWGLFGIILLVIWLRRGNDPSRQAGRRLGNLILGTAVLLAITLPVLIYNRDMIWRYYVVGHVTGGEKYIRMRQMGVVNAATFLLYYPKSILLGHLARGFDIAALVGLIGAVWARMAGKREIAPADPPTRASSPLPLQGLLLICVIAAPLLALTADVSKSPVVGGIVAIPIALLVVQIMAALTESVSGKLSCVLTGAAAVMLVVGVYKTVDKGAKHGLAYADRDSIQRLVQASDWMVKYSADHGWQQPRLSCDSVSGWYNDGTLNCLAYEQDGRIMDFQLLLGAQINAISRSAALSDLAASDFAILSEPYQVGPYPFGQGVAGYWQDLKTWCDRNMTAVESFPFRGQVLHVYVRHR
jgi:hypothetical protein